MAELNKVFLIGRLTKDPDELRYTPNGAAVTRLRMASNHTWRANNEKKEEVLFIDVSVFGKSAEIAKQYLAKGREVLVEGRLQMNDWTDKQGQKRRDFRLVADRVHFLSSGGRGGGRDAEAETAPPQDAYDAAEPPAASEGMVAQQGDDLPF